MQPTTPMPATALAALPTTLYPARISVTWFGPVATKIDYDQIAAEYARHRQALSVYFSETVEIELQRYPRIADLRSFFEPAPHP
jgi:hypothetical protein